MSTAVEKQLRAAQKYLTLVKTLPVFEGVREQQLQDIKQKLEQVSLNVDQAACLVDLLDETVWGSSLDELRAAMTPRAGSAADNVRKQQQDYTWFLHYITSSMWKGMESLDGPNALELWLEEPYRTICGDALDVIFWYPWAAFGFWEMVLDAAAQGIHQKAIGQRWKMHFAFASIAGKSRRITWGVTAACLPFWPLLCRF